MMSALPCIATLLELHPEKGASQGGEESPVKGRVLLQNELSLAYWGKLNTKIESGVQIWDHLCIEMIDIYIPFIYTPRTMPSYLCLLPIMPLF